MTPPTPVPGFRFALRDSHPLTGDTQFLSDRWTLAVGSIASVNSSLEKLQQDLLADGWMAWNHRESSIWVEAASNGVSAKRTLGCVGLLGLNRRVPTGVTDLNMTDNRVRVIIDSFPVASRVRPELVTLNTTNLSGGISDLIGPVTVGGVGGYTFPKPIDPPQDSFVNGVTVPFTPDGYAETKLNPVNTGLGIAIEATWEANWETERALFGAQAIRIHVRDVNDPDKVPVPTAELKQGPPGPTVTIATLTPAHYEHIEASSSSGGFIINYAWDASLMVNPGGAVTFHFSTPTACDVIGLELVTNMTGHLYDSGTLEYNTKPLDKLALRLDLDLNGPDHWICVLPSDFCTYELGTFDRVGGGTVANVRTYGPIIPRSMTWEPGSGAQGRFFAGRFLGADTARFPVMNEGGYNLRKMTNASPSYTRGGSFRKLRSGIEYQEADLLIVIPSRGLLRKLNQLFDGCGLLRRSTLLIPDPDMTEGIEDPQTEPRWVMISTWGEQQLGHLTGEAGDPEEDEDSSKSYTRWDQEITVIDAQAQMVR